MSPTCRSRTPNRTLHQKALGRSEPPRGAERERHQATEKVAQGCEGEGVRYRHLHDHPIAAHRSARKPSAMKTGGDRLRRG